MNLKEARKKGLEAFIKEHEKDAPGDLDRLNKAIKRPASGKSSEVPKASSQPSDDD